MTFVGAGDVFVNGVCVGVFVGVVSVEVDVVFVGVNVDVVCVGVLIGAICVFVDVGVDVGVGVGVFVVAVIVGVELDFMAEDEDETTFVDICATVGSCTFGVVLVGVFLVEGDDVFLEVCDGVKSVFESVGSVVDCVVKSVVDCDVDSAVLGGGFNVSNI